ncbi:hypothetical protein K435DRAFT_891286 [Dendrothele bispora CBS 962.96]|uniref:F-box domain-containing protein n=1 Tax=Dendrothele bispora (strain CBS 962.96) TaxID=1314807 RepID=A0A4S8M4W7_DENBC|nr:hypothetical protein K435DRAFT_891286 [Dendrothele bispora CBS 962.96]
MPRLLRTLQTSLFSVLVHLLGRFNSKRVKTTLISTGEHDSSENMFDTHSFEPIRSSLSVQRLPLNVLFEILDICVLSNPYRDHVDSVKHIQTFRFMDNPAWKLSQVCSGWRTAARNRRGLWTQFLSLRTLPQCLPWLKLLQDNLPSLRKLQLEMICKNSGPTPRNPIQLFRVAPLLEEVSIWSLSGNCQPLALDQHRLYRLEAPMSAISDIRLLTTLQDCSLYLNQAGHRLFQQTLTSYSLQNLALREHPDINTGSALRLLDSLLLPNLRRFSIRTCDNALIGSNIRKFLARSGCDLMDLDIDIHGLYFGDLVEIFRLCSELRRLRLITPPCPSLLEQLRPVPGSDSATCLLPHLEILDLSSAKYGIRHFEHDFPELCRTIWIRGFEDNLGPNMTGLVKLQELHLWTGGDLTGASFKLRSTMTGLIERGLKVYDSDVLLDMDAFDVEDVDFEIGSEEGKGGEL